ncbi:dynamin family protein [Achromobacter sp.]|uniref:dynamin family protein n=1 Tax=Achromobacter sp. TaxID=134375 RepID=UPI0028AA4CE5|nr:dynamin family protein [Achromobacter sp.]
MKNNPMTRRPDLAADDEKRAMTRDEFLQVFRNLAGRFEENQQKASQTEHSFFSGLNTCRDLAGINPFESSRLDDDHPLRQHLHGAVDRIKDVFVAWDETIDKLETHATFKKQIEDSLLVFVYGKVKAGKSSLGNYIARGCTKPVPMAAGEAGAPVFFVQEGRELTEKVSAESIRRAGAFKVGEGETTSAIQGFQLPGLTWVDSPGLHSKHAENGELAQKYVDAADLILYLTNSMAPCKRSDLEELKTLGSKEHNLAVLITGSDQWIEDEDENGDPLKELAMKTQTVREQQIHYVRDSLRKQHCDVQSKSTGVMDKTLQRAKVHSVSVVYAEEHPDSVGMQSSGMGAMLYDVAMLAQSAGVRDKLVRPLKNLRHFLNVMRTAHLPKIQSALNGLTASIATTKSKAETDARQRIQGIALRIAPAIDALIEQHASAKDSRAFKTALAQAYSRWLGEARDSIADAYANSLGERLTRAMDSAIDLLPDFEDVKKSIPRRSTVNAKRGAALGGALSALAALAVPGGVLLAAGAAVLSSALGGFAGKKIGATLDDTEIAEMVIGNNANEVGAKARAVLSEKFRRESETTLTNLQLSCYSELEAWLSGLNREVNQVTARTEALLSELDAQLTNA